MKISNRQQILAIAAIAIVAFFVLDKLVIGPLTESWKSRSAAVAELRKSIAQAQLTLERENTTRSRWNQVRKATLPLNGSQAEQEILKAFDKWSSGSAISISSIKPQWKRGTTDDYSILECRVEAMGSLPVIARFLYEVERSPTALKIDSIELTSRDNNGEQIALGLSVSGLRLAPLEGK
jgi:hypothetical protein